MNLEQLDLTGKDLRDADCTSTHNIKVLMSPIAGPGNPALNQTMFDIISPGAVGGKHDFRAPKTQRGITSGGVTTPSGPGHDNTTATLPSVQNLTASTQN